MELNPYLHFSGDCEAAFKFYAQLTGGKIEFMMKHGEAPGAQVDPGWRDKIMHAALVIDGQRLLGSDAPPQYYQHPQGFSVSLSLSDKQKGQTIFNALSEGGKVKMPFQETFWAAGFGMLEDRFGIPWMINCEKPR